MSLNIKRSETIIEIINSNLDLNSDERSRIYHTHYTYYIEINWKIILSTEKCLEHIWAKSEKIQKATFHCHLLCNKWVIMKCTIIIVQKVNSNWLILPKSHRTVELCEQSSLLNSMKYHASCMCDCHCCCFSTLKIHFESGECLLKYIYYAVYLKAITVFITYYVWNNSTDFQNVKQIHWLSEKERNRVRSKSRLIYDCNINRCRCEQR